MSSHRGDDHLRSAGAALSLFSKLLGALLSAGRSADAVRQYRGRIRAAKHAEKTRALIQAGAVSGMLQNARLGNRDDLKEMGYLDPDAGPFIAYSDDQPIHLNSDKHVAVMGLSGTGKGVSVIMPAIVDLAKKQAGSMLIVDVKSAELSWTTAEGVEELQGQAADFINPWCMHGRPNMRVNFLQNLVDAAVLGLPIVDELKAKMRSVFGDVDAKYAQNAWIWKTASLISEAVGGARAYHDPEALTPGHMWDFSKSTHAEFAELMLEASTLPECDGYIAMCARKLYDQYGREPIEQWDWVMEAMAEAWSLYGRGSVLREATSRTDVDFTSYKRQPRCAYLMTPDKFLASHAGYITAVTEYAIETMAHAPGPMRISVFADEWSSLPRMDNALKWLRMYRENGIRLWTFTQDRNGFNAYKNDGGYRPFEENSIRLLWGVSDPNHLQDLERRAGYRSVLVPNQSASIGMSSDGRNDGASEQITPVLPVSAIGQICEGRAILDVPGRAIFVVDRKPWWDIPEVARYVRDKRKNPPPAFETFGFKDQQ